MSEEESDKVEDIKLYAFMAAWLFLVIFAVLLNAWFWGGLCSRF